MSTSETSPRGDAAFTLVEVMVGLVIAACLAAALAPLWLSLQRTGEGECDRAIWYLQGRVAVARFERDLRLSGAAGCRFPIGGSIVEATRSQVVFLERGSEGDRPLLIEWEIVRGTLMRRWGPCPSARPTTFSHTIYSDNKTMLESLGTGSALRYYSGGVELSSAQAASATYRIDSVMLDLVGGRGTGSAGMVLNTSARVGR